MFLDSLILQRQGKDKESQKSIIKCSQKPTIGDQVFTNFGFDDIQPEAPPEKNFIQLNAQIAKAGSRSYETQKAQYAGSIDYGRTLLRKGDRVVYEKGDWVDPKT